MSYQIVFLDIDGTILKPDHTIEDSTKTAIRRVQELGIKTVLATGRPIHEIAEIGSELNIHSYIGYNGALAIYDKQEIFSEPMKAESVNYFVDTAKKHGHHLVLYTDSKNYFTSLIAPEVQTFTKTFHLRKNAVFSNDVIQRILGMTIITSSENDQSLYTPEDGIHLSQVNVDGMQHCFDVIRDQVNKGIAVSFLLSRLGIPKKHAIAFGDGMNDKEMLNAVEESFAMGNAHESLFFYAKHKTTSVTESGVYNGLKKLGIMD